MYNFCALLLVALAVLLQEGSALTCYNCQYADTPGKVGYECVTDPSQVSQDGNTVLCTGAINDCITKRVVQAGVVYSMSRSCNNFGAVDGCEDPGNQETCITTCSGEDLCNSDNVDLPTPENTTIPIGPTTTTTPPPPGIECYSCQYSYNPGADDACLVDPSSQRTVTCRDGKTCYVQSQWDIYEEVWRSFARGCEDMSNIPSGCTPSTYFIDRLTICTSNHCNERVVGAEGDSCPPDGPTDESPVLKASGAVLMLAAIVAILQGWY